MKSRIAFLRVSKTLHLLLSVIAFYIGWTLMRYNVVLFHGETGFRYNYYVALLYGAMLFFFFKTYSAYLFGYSRVRTLVFKQMLSQGFSTVLVYFITAVAWNKWLNPAGLLVNLALSAVIDVVMSMVMNRTFYSCNPPRQTLVLYSSAADKARLDHLTLGPLGRLYRCTDFMQCGKDDLGKAIDAIAKHEAVFTSGLDAELQGSVSVYCIGKRIPCFVLPRVGNLLFQGARHVHTLSSPVLMISGKEPSIEYLFVKRAFDIIMSLLGILVLSPLFLLCAAAIFLTDRGPVIYRQKRLTKGGKVFTICKFRSMRVDAEKDGVARLSSGESDERITPVGRILRACRLDELPQLFNILKGDMTIVGPRPERPEIAEQYEKIYPEFSLRTQVKAGLTGYAQVYGKYNTEPLEKLEFDIMYINHMSIITDLQLMFATVGILFNPDSTEGILTDTETALNTETALKKKENE